MIGRRWSLLAGLALAVALVGGVLLVRSAAAPAPAVAAGECRVVASEVPGARESGLRVQPLCALPPEAAQVWKQIQEAPGALGPFRASHDGRFCTLSGEDDAVPHLVGFGQQAGDQGPHALPATAVVDVDRAKEGGVLVEHHDPERVLDINGQRVAVKRHRRESLVHVIDQGDEDALNGVEITEAEDLPSCVRATGEGAQGDP